MFEKSIEKAEIERKKEEERKAKLEKSAIVLEKKKTKVFNLK